ncbi:MAG: NAD(P)-dependent oxidoreductase [Rhizobiales bacterium]|nr:NAD(P)-dependent oxidoreductase [Hyphomicrobiales bacterium]
MSIQTLGFIGLGTMGEPMCQHLAQKSGLKVIAYDRQAEPLQRLATLGVSACESIDLLTRTADVIFMALPSGVQVEDVCNNHLLPKARPGQIIVDLGTSPVTLTQLLAERFQAKGVRYADAPIARTRQAAQEGRLSVMVGCDANTYATLEPLISCFASDVTRCGDVGAGQVVKILNNMVLVETVVALSEAITIARRAGVDGEMLFKTLMKGSADSFALRNHGMKSVLPENFPERAFSTDYARKDISYALALGDQFGVPLPGARTADKLLASASEKGLGEYYWPVISKVIAADTTQ